MTRQPTPHAQIPNMLDAYSRVEALANRCDRVLNQQDDERLFEPKVQGLARVMISASRAQVQIGAQIERLNRPKTVSRFRRDQDTSVQLAFPPSSPPSEQSQPEVSQEKLNSLDKIINLLETGVAAAEAMQRSSLDASPSCHSIPLPVISNDRLPADDMVRKLWDSEKSPSSQETPAPLSESNPPVRTERELDALIDALETEVDALETKQGYSPRPHAGEPPTTSQQEPKISLSQSPFEYSEEEWDALLDALEIEVAALKAKLRSSSNPSNSPQEAAQTPETASPPPTERHDASGHPP